jgi:hypothetical protein
MYRVRSPPSETLGPDAATPQPTQLKRNPGQSGSFDRVIFLQFLPIFPGQELSPYPIQCIDFESVKHKTGSVTCFGCKRAVL